MLALSSRAARPTASAASHIRLANGGIEVEAPARPRRLSDAGAAASNRVEEVHEVAVLIAEQLHFDMAGPADELFEEYVGDAERGAG